MNEALITGEDFKESVRLLIECMDQLRLHDAEYQHVTDGDLKRRLWAFMVKHGIDDAEKAADALGIPSLGYGEGGWL